METINNKFKVAVINKIAQIHLKLALVISTFLYLHNLQHIRTYFFESEMPNENPSLFLKYFSKGDPSMEGVTHWDSESDMVVDFGASAIFQH